MADLSIVIVNWSTREDLLKCLESLGEFPAQVVVVDNASSDGSAGAVRERFPRVELIENRRNAGFARANNQAFARARGRYILLLNPDTVANGDAIRGLVDFMDRTPRAGAAGLQLRFPDGRLQNSYDSFPTFGSELISKHLMRLLFPGRYPSKRVIPTGPIPVDLVIGACLILRREVVDALGGFDERYFLFMEEADLCFRIWRAGWEIYHLPHHSIIHDARGSKEQATGHAYIEYARSSYRFYSVSLGPARALLLKGLKTLKVVFVNPTLSLLAFAFTLGKVPRHRRRLRIRMHLCAWHLLGCPRSWGMREVSSLRDFERSRKGGRETIASRDTGPGLRALLESGSFPIPPGPGEREFTIQDPDGQGLLRFLLFPPGGILGRLRGVRAVPHGILYLERAEEVKDRGIPALTPRAAGAVRRFGIPGLSFVVFSNPCELIPLSRGMPEDPREGPSRFTALARFLRELHDRGIDPGPALASSVFFRETGGDPVLADPRHVRIGPPLTRGERIASLRKLGRLDPGLTPGARRRFLSAYWRGPSRQGRRIRRPIRVLHLFSNHKVTGPAETALDTAIALAALPGVEAEFAAGYGSPGADGLRGLAAERGASVAGLVLRLEKHFAPMSLILDALRLRRILRSDPPDLIHCHLPGDHLVAALGAPSGIPIIRSLYDGAAPPWTWRARKTLGSRSARIICFSEAVREALLGDPSAILPGRLVRMDPPIDLNRFDPGRSLPDFRQELGIPPGAFLAGIAARLQTHRRFEVIFEAVARARREVPDLRFAVIGRGTHAESVAAEPVRRLGLEGVVHLTGYLSGDLYVGMLKALDALVFLMPGSDGTCRAVREGLAMGLPVIAARRGMLPELVRQGETGILLDDTPENLADSLVHLARHRELRDGMAARAREEAMARFSQESHSRALAGVYREVLAEP